MIRALSWLSRSWEENEASARYGRPWAALESRLVVPVQRAFRRSRFTGSGYTMKRRPNATAMALLLSEYGCARRIGNVTARGYQQAAEYQLIRRLHKGSQFAHS